MTPRKRKAREKQNKRSQDKQIKSLNKKLSEKENENIVLKQQKEEFQKANHKQRATIISLQSDVAQIQNQYETAQQEMLQLKVSNIFIVLLR